MCVFVCVCICVSRLVCAISHTHTHTHTAIDNERAAMEADVPQIKEGVYVCVCVRCVCVRVCE